MGAESQGAAICQGQATRQRETSTKPRLRGEFNTLTVAEVTALCDDAVAVTFAVPPELADAYVFRAGQSLTLRRMIDGRDQRRSYSICSPEGSAPRIGVREVPDGLFSTWLVREVRPGDQIEVSTPTGTFTPDRSAPEHHVLIAAGSGITPVLSITATVLRDPGTTVTLFYGNRRTNTVMFSDELADLKDRYPARFELVHVLSREPREAELFTGRLDGDKITALLGLLPDVSGVDDWWLCGPFGIITAARECLMTAGASAKRFHQELFYVDDVPPKPVRHKEKSLAESSTEATVVLDGRSTTVTIARDVPVLESAQRARPDVPFACKGGVCGTCRGKITTGQVAMRRNFALETTEVDEGFVLTCQSLPLSDTLTVDFDS